MNITSTLFLFLFLPAVLLLFCVFINRKLRIGLLLAASLFFYAWGDLRSLPILLVLLILNWLLARLRTARGSAGEKKTLLVITVAADIGVLLYYKYLAFFFSFFPAAWLASLPLAPTLLPLGISFFIFKIISFQVDSYRKPELTHSSFFEYALYVSFFAQILSGPITRYEPIIAQLETLRPQKALFAQGTERFALGLIKKILIAEQVSTVANAAFGLVTPGAPLAWAGALAYTLQLYFDFSGYSDMAIGLGMFFGLLTPENFDHPYASTSVQEFWRRWHISLSGWFRDYVYFSLGGSRCSLARTCLNTLIVFALTGLWHGANLTFVIWGIYHALFIILERTALKKLLKKCPHPLSWLYMMLVVLIGWVPFRADSIRAAQQYLGSMFGASGVDWLQLSLNVSAEKLLALMCGCVFAFPIWGGLRAHMMKKVPALYYLLVAILFLAALCYLVGNGFSPFLYIQF